MQKVYDGKGLRICISRVFLRHSMSGVRPHDRACLGCSTGATFGSRE